MIATVTVLSEYMEKVCNYHNVSIFVHAIIRLLPQFKSDRSSLPPVLNELDQTLVDLWFWLIDESQFRKTRANMLRVTMVSNGMICLL